MMPPGMDPLAIASAMIDGPAKVAKLLENIDTRLQEIRDAVILQYCISAIAVANESKVDFDVVIGSARDYATSIADEVPTGEPL